MPPSRTRCLPLVVTRIRRGKGVCGTRHVPGYQILRYEAPLGTVAHALLAQIGPAAGQLESQETCQQLHQDQVVLNSGVASIPPALNTPPATGRASSTPHPPHSTRHEPATCTPSSATGTSLLPYSSRGPPASCHRLRQRHSPHRPRSPASPCSSAPYPCCTPALRPSYPVMHCTSTLPHPAAPLPSAHLRPPTGICHGARCATVL